MDFKQWIYSSDIAQWLSEKRNLSLTERTDCILSEPHRTLGEKLEGLRELYREAILPFVQFLKRYGGTLSESERWLGELGELVRRDKSCFALILRDRQPGKQPKGEADRPREYVKELEKRLRQGETKRLAKEKRRMKSYGKTP